MSTLPIRVVRHSDNDFEAEIVARNNVVVHSRCFSRAHNAKAYLATLAQKASSASVDIIHEGPYDFGFKMVFTPGRVVKETSYDCSRDAERGAYAALDALDRASVFGFTNPKSIPVID